MDEIKEIKKEGDLLYKSGRFGAAIDCYTRAINASSSGVSDSTREVLSQCYSNRSACLMQQKNYAEALADAQTVTAIRPQWYKGWFRVGEAYVRLAGDTDERSLVKAISSFERALSLEPSATDTSKALQSARSKLLHLRQHPETPHTTTTSSTSSHHSSSQQNRNAFTDLSFSTILDRIKSFASFIFAKAMSYLTTLSDFQKQSILLFIGGFLLYSLLFSRSNSYSYYDSYGDSYGYGRGLTWVQWAMLMLAAYKIPPMFPEILGQYALPFFGLNWTTFIWLVQIFTNSRSGFGGSRMFGYGHRRRY